ncbi:MAG TPA: hypothetical protein VJT82_11185 [Pyrinomonadaceae bacterium]|nr:hypothetical protein [Pyrinomonadaceae bacterium]
MRVPSAAELLAIWEEGITQHPVNRAVMLLALVRPDMPKHALAEVSLGERDAQLLSLRERLFGTRLRSLAVCPDCAERLELDFDINDIRVPAPERPQLAGEVSVETGDYVVRCRLPNSADLLAVADSADADAAQQELLTRCVLAIERSPDAGTGAVEGIAPDALAVAELPPSAVEAVVGQMQQADPQVDVQLSLTCTTCRRSWLMAFDIASYLWDEIGDWAQRTLREVHALASFYGWREADILAMSARRRQWYLEMIGA